ncbi:MAG: CYTH domain-containing protein [Huintestinicola sp.]
MAYEIERKFLISFPDDPESGCEKKIDIVQTYLKRNDPALQRRVRSMTVNGETVYYYTEKRFVSSITREENEKTISREEYEGLLLERDEELVPIIKTRRVYSYGGLVFEMDSYPFSDSLATIEAELPSEDAALNIPPYFHVIKEVTGDKRYSNANLALNQKFPE